MTSCGGCVKSNKNESDSVVQNRHTWKYTQDLKRSRYQDRIKGSSSGLSFGLQDRQPLAHPTGLTSFEDFVMRKLPFSPIKEDIVRRNRLLMGYDL